MRTFISASIVAAFLIVSCSKLPTIPTQIIHDTDSVFVTQIDTIFQIDTLRTVEIDSFFGEIHDTTYIDTTRSPQRIGFFVNAQFGIRADREPKTHDTVFDVPREGFYRVFAFVYFNSGNEQKNESLFLTIGSDNLAGPINGNPFVIVNDRNDSLVRDIRYAGTFFLSKGTNTIRTMHYSLISDLFPDFLNGDIRGAESVYVEKFCFISL